MQPTFNHYKAVAYMCAYMSKSESECSLAMKQAFRDAFEKELNSYEEMKLVANACINKRECNIYECVYHILRGQWLRKRFLGKMFANRNVPGTRIRVCLGEDETSELPKDSKKVFNQSIVDRYVDRPIQVLVASLAFLIPFVLLSFQDTIIFHQILNIRKMITNQKNLMMRYLRIYLTHSMFISNK